ncbi:MAG: uracil phosphoribosyltransferase [Defluviitaleaceae bacterium]|nr:uracil phosphoribosyltransferase [Defluviitaleaceae bacterium]
MGIRQVQNPLINHYVGVIRDKATGKNDFANAIESIVYLMSHDITGNIGTARKKVMTPLAEADVAYFFDKVLIVPILRAGMAMFEPLRKVLPMATFGYMGIRRGHKDGEIFADMYYKSLPDDLADHKVILTEVVVATGSTIDYTIEHLLKEGVKEESITLATIISSKPGLDGLTAKYPKVNILTCAIDEILDERGYIIPGLGDAGDRYNGC